MNRSLVQAEEMGKTSFKSGAITSHKQAEKVGRKTFATVIERDCFVAGWNMAYWDEQARVLRNSK